MRPAAAWAAWAVWVAWAARCDDRLNGSPGQHRPARPTIHSFGARTRERRHRRRSRPARPLLVLSARRLASPVGTPLHRKWIRYAAAPERCFGAYSGRNAPRTWTAALARTQPRKVACSRYVDTSTAVQTAKTMAAKPS